MENVLEREGNKIKWQFTDSELIDAFYKIKEEYWSEESLIPISINEGLDNNDFENEKSIRNTFKKLGIIVSEQANITIFKEAGTTEITDIIIPINPDAHDWNAPSYQWLDEKTVKASRVCSNNTSHIESEDGTVTSEVTQKATCSVPEETTYTATFTNPVFATRTKTVTSGDIDPNAHDWGEVTYKWAKDNSSVTAIRTCKNNISHNETETVQTTKTVTKEATETAPGDILYSAEFSNPAFKKQTKYEEIPAKGTSETKKSDEPLARN